MVGCVSIYAQLPELEHLLKTTDLLTSPSILGTTQKSDGAKIGLIDPGCKSSGSRAEMETKTARFFLHELNEEIDRTIEQMCSC
ncbi:hypothetical protein TNCV_8061 [Trichonephila clavipes]|nr:hypothetical protein TNCV_8061 [Trichonephila clavipes]